MNRKRKNDGLLAAVAMGLAIVLACTSTSGPRATNAYTLVSDTSFADGHPAVNEDGTINVVIEIPAGTNAKWEVDKGDGTLRWEFRKGAPRVVRYLPYPANYGMVPRTLLPEDQGGDGDPLDVIVICPALERGTVVSARVIGVLQLLDGGEHDAKLLAVVNESPLGSVDDIDELDEKFPGVTAILEEWFTGYKGPGEMESLGYANAETAWQMLEAAARAYEQRR